MNPVGYGNLPSPLMVATNVFMRTFRLIDTAAIWKSRRTKKSSRRKKIPRTKEKMNNNAGNR